MSEWKFEPPKVIGDYVASISKDENARRHWNGTNWSAPWYAGDPPDIVNRAGNTPAEAGGSPIAWLRRVDFDDDDDDMVSLMKPRAKQFSRWMLPEIRVSCEKRYTSLGANVFAPSGVFLAACDSPHDACRVAEAMNAYYVVRREAAQC